MARGRTRTVPSRARFSSRAMVRTKPGRERQPRRARAVTRARTMRKIATRRRVTRVLSSQEARALPSPEARVRAHAQREGGRLVGLGDGGGETSAGDTAGTPAVPGMRRERAAERRLPRRQSRRRRPADGWADARARGGMRGHGAAGASCSLRVCEGSALVGCRGDAAGRAGGGRGHVDARMDGRRTALAVAPEGKSLRSVESGAPPLWRPARLRTISRFVTAV